MKNICVAICTASIFGHAVFGQDHQSVKAGIETAGVAGLTVYQTALARPDLAVAKSLINERLLKGEIGEAISDQTIGRYYYRSSQMRNVSPRLGRQGIDHILMSFDENGVPDSLSVVETKFGSSQLGTTGDGIQLGERWTNKHLQALANRYRMVAEDIRLGQIPIVKQPHGIESRQSFPVPLANDKEAVVWRHNSQSKWFVDCPPEYIQQIPGKLDSMATCASSRNYEKLLNHVKIEGNLLKVDILDATRVDAVEGNLGKLPVKASLEFSLNRTVWASDTIQIKMAGEIRSQMPYLDADEAKGLAQGIQSTETAEDALTQSSFKSFATIEAAKAGTAGVLIAVPVEIAFQLINGGQVDWQRVAGVGVLAGGSAAIGSRFGNATTFALMRTEAGYSASSAVAELVGIRSASHFANGAGGLVGGGATVILFAYGGYWLGYYDLKTANRSAVAGVAGVGAGAVLTAELGGTAVVGSSVLASTGVGIVVIGVTAAVIYGFQVYDEHEDNIRLGKTIEYLTLKPTFFISSEQSFNIIR
jgi:hypothetical protein